MLDSQTGIEVKTAFSPLALFLYFCTPRIEIDGVVTKHPWGTHFLPLSPGTHQIRIYFQYFFLSKCGANSIQIEVRDGQAARISYYMPSWMLAKGSIKDLSEPLEVSTYTFACPHCEQHLEAPHEILGQTVECPSCRGQITIPEPVIPRRVVRKRCPLCGCGEHMADGCTLYGYAVCKKCHDSFASRRQLAFFLDVLIYLVVGGVVIGGLMTAIGPFHSQQATQAMGTASRWLALLLLLFKDFFFGQSGGKAMCGVKVIDKTTGAPGGLLASFKRNLPLLIPIMPLIVAVQVGKGNRTGDGWANTKVIWKKYANYPIFLPAASSAPAS